MNQLESNMFAFFISSIFHLSTWEDIKDHLWIAGNLFLCYILFIIFGFYMLSTAPVRMF